MVLGGAYVLLFRAYTADAIFSPQSKDASGGVGGLAQQLGLPNLTGNQEGPEFYRALLVSRDLLSELASSRYRFARRPGSPDTLEGNIMELYKVKGRSPEEKLARATAKLRANLSVGTNRGAYVVSIRMRAKWPGLAEQEARRLLDLVNEFNLGKRQSRSAEERKFTESQLVEARAELEAAEAAQARFLERNRAFRDDPRLSTEMQRLTRRVDLAQQAFLTLSQSAQQARIEEVRNTPLITVIQSPEHSARVSQITAMLPRRRLSKGR
jgi:uncharacterized protein involved in exopolysaccharide biosynthesis